MTKNSYLLLFIHTPRCLLPIYNKWKNRSGALFVKPYGSAPKRTKKAIMTCISYIANNPVLKHLCSNAQDYIWRFIPYVSSSNPFSERLIVREASSALKKAINIVKINVKNNRHLSYQSLRMLFHNLSIDERAQIIDHIIMSYQVIDHNESIKYYGSYDKMLMAVNSNSGTEYDVKEDWDSQSDKIFQDMIAIADKMQYGGERGFNFQNTGERELRKLAKYIYNHSKATELHIAKFFHIELGRAIDYVRFW